MTDAERKFIIRATKFINIAAGEGIWFKGDEDYTDELDATDIICSFYEGCGCDFPDYVPDCVKKDFT